ncbi:MAG: undecaprenyldiphospho-muramoylpentapeptide beta-N-acetylglucosaminyltransferase [Desulfobacterales bacterium]|jgi:UDP-N-acetylglucosamine--N-acetylmuramyl-(pentapeptide) pyrophosphoryl-undecaprenol N-acetylglucosamine transferase
MGNEDHKTLGIVITGGGTGGHLFPGIAVAREFQARVPDARILFLGTGKAVEISVLAREGFDHRVIAASGFKGMGMLGKMNALVALPRGIAGAHGILSAFGPDLVIGVGSYSAGPVAVAARLRGIPVVLHEQNAIPGLTNRLLAHLAQRIYISLPASGGHFPPGKTRLTGNPVRPELLDDAQGPSVQQSAERPFTVLVAGGSQGAHAINQAVIDLLPLIDDPGTLAFIHQTGETDESPVKRAYRQHGVAAEVAAFFSDMGKRYRQADLVVCRAGATTTAELACLGKPSVLIPYPHAADNHQEHNAMGLVAAEAAEMVREADLTPEGLWACIQRYRSTPERLAAMSAKAKALGNPKAAVLIVSDCLDLIRKRHRTSTSAGGS